MSQNPVAANDKVHIAGTSKTVSSVSTTVVNNKTQVTINTSDGKSITKDVDVVTLSGKTSDGGSTYVIGQ